MLEFSCQHLLSVVTNDCISNAKDWWCCCQTASRCRNGTVTDCLTSKVKYNVFDEKNFTHGSELTEVKDINF